jgi:hypothetical protein
VERLQHEEKKGSKTRDQPIYQLKEAA